MAPSAGGGWNASVRHILEKKRTNEEQKYMKETLSRLLEEKQMGSLFKVIFGYKNKNDNFFGFE